MGSEHLLKIPYYICQWHQQAWFKITGLGTGFAEVYPS